MKIILITTSWLFFALNAVAQVTDTAYTRVIAEHRIHYKQEFLTEKRSPLTEKDTAFLHFYPADKQWNVTAGFTATPDAEPFDMPTYSGRTKKFVAYGNLTFKVNGSEQKLTIYRNLQLSNIPDYKDHLFLPFKDATNTHDTYGGGRYIDLRDGDIQDGKVVVDFNKAYNPWCAYSDGFNCPVPPMENHLKIEVKAGEMMFSGEKKH